MLDTFRIALCIPKRSFAEHAQGVPYVVAVPGSMKKFHLRSDFVKYLEDRDILLDLGTQEPDTFIVPQLSVVDQKTLKYRMERVATIPKLQLESFDPDKTIIDPIKGRIYVESTVQTLPISI